jgi:hypothetical protein
MRRANKPSNPASSWDVVKIAKNENVLSFPKTIYKNGIVNKEGDLPDKFAGFFCRKMKDLINVVNEARIDDQV